ncbi:MetQ/NlpA family ABC transporter substrate-binding protein [Leptospira idonii]|uniref:Lipoprotein n=1 Tax=Leptospira idonii TaxID=1193500 RepID=A0A4R9M2U8_9LEPT|nr:MetQ/NlpA family ABC transporter substrate-binding protein [Leptospira idonii]TGN21114.1 metal ABC transporter substrate-binding protein [Leptospira idonii]
MKPSRIFSLTLLFLLFALASVFCGGKTSPLPGDRKNLKIGICPGPYGDMIQKAILPSLSKKGYTVEIVTFSDYIQPNLALSNRDIDANLFQHVPYLVKFSKDKGLKLNVVINIPTAPMTVFGGKTKDPKDLPNNASIALPNDPTNQIRALKLFQELGFIKVNPNADATKTTLKDIVENKKNIQFLPLEAAQLPRSLESTNFTAINGNFALSAGLKLTDAVKLETLAEEHKNVIVVREEDKDAEFAKDIEAAVRSKEFAETINRDFQGFQKPDWLEK